MGTTTKKHPSTTHIPSSTPPIDTHQSQHENKKSRHFACNLLYGFRFTPTSFVCRFLPIRSRPCRFFKRRIEYRTTRVPGPRRRRCYHRRNGRAQISRAWRQRTSHHLSSEGSDT